MTALSFMWSKCLKIHSTLFKLKVFASTCVKSALYAWILLIYLSLTGP